jgi:hypothetical protein
MLTKNDELETVDKFYGCGDRVRVLRGSYEGLTGKCYGFSLFNVEVEMDDINLGYKDFCPENLEKIK